MSGAHSSMLEDCTSAASRDQASLDQLQQTAARGQTHVQGKLAALLRLSVATWSAANWHTSHLCLKPAVDC